jgi:hypothetical protein
MPDKRNFFCRRLLPWPSSSSASGKIPDAIRAKESSREIVQEYCIRCHEETVFEVWAGSMEMDRYCFDYRRTAAHGYRGVSISHYKHEVEWGKVHISHAAQVNRFCLRHGQPPLEIPISSLPELLWRAGWLVQGTP